MRAFYQIARNTFRECLREPIFLILLFSSLFIIGLLPTFTLFIFRQQVKMVIDNAMATSLLFGMITAVLCASHAIDREIRNGTVMLILSKPIQRPVFILAKIVGILQVLLVYGFLTSLATLMAVRVAKDQFRLDWTIFYLFWGAILLAFLLALARNYYQRKVFSEQTVYALLITMTLAATITFYLPVKGEFVGFSSSIALALVLLSCALLAMAAFSTAL